MEDEQSWCALLLIIFMGSVWSLYEEAQETKEELRACKERAYELKRKRKETIDRLGLKIPDPKPTELEEEEEIEFNREKNDNIQLAAAIGAVTGAIFGGVFGNTLSPMCAVLGAMLGAAGGARILSGRVKLYYNKKYNVLLKQHIRRWERKRGISTFEPPQILKIRKDTNKNQINFKVVIIVLLNHQK